MIKIVFGIMLAGAIYYVITPLLGRRVRWVDAEDPVDERIRELELKKRINLKALKDIEFELASGKINEEDHEELRTHYLHRVSRIMNRIETLAGGKGPSSEDPFEAGTDSPGPEHDDGPDEEEITAAHGGGRSASRAAAGWEPEETSEEFQEEDEGDLHDEWEEDEEEEEDGSVANHGADEEDDDEWEEEDEYPRRGMRGPAVAVLAFALAVGTGAALFQMGRRSAAKPPAAPAASFYPPSGEQTGLEHLVRYVQENPWNVTSHLILGEYYLGEGDTDLALSHFISAEQVAPNDGRVLSDLGKVYRKLGDPDQAIEKFRAAADAEPESLEHLYQLGLVYGYDKADPDQAVRLFEEILSRQPDEELRATVDEELRKMIDGNG